MDVQPTVSSLSRGRNLSSDFWRLKRGSRGPILREGRNCWRKEKAERLSYVIDAANYFQAFYEAAERAEEQLIVVGWDTDSRVELLVGQSQTPVRLKDFLVDLCERKPNLKVYVLSWNFSFIYSMEREVFSQLKFEWNGHPRICFHLDSFHATLGSHHQKVVVVDDQVAFSGGLDITARRWDTSEHKANDTRRTDPWGKTYGPFHDVQMAVHGPAAKALGDLVRERWFRATGEKLNPPNVSAAQLHWPSSLNVDVQNVQVGIARTVPALPGIKPVREVERLFTDSISEAKDFIFFEAQYLSSKSIARALARRLREPSGPEVVLILARDATGWIEESTMSVLRARVLEIIRNADIYNRFRIFHPIVPDLTDGYVKVHSKVTIIDDKFARIGSANLNQRSMGLDTECDLAFEAGDDLKTKEAIASLRYRLMAEHLDISVSEVRRKFEETGSLIRTIDALKGKPRTLVQLERNIPLWLDMVVPESEVIDPSSPYRLKRGLRRYFPNFASAVSSRNHWLGQFKILSLVIILLALLALWKLSPLGDLVRPEKISMMMEGVRANPFGPLIVIAAFILGGLVMVPLMAMIVATGLTFESWMAFLIALTGSMGSAMLTYSIGSKFHPEALANLTNRWLQKIKSKMAAGGWVTIAIVRMLPVAPFTIVNLVAGSIKIPLRDYLIGTVAGLMPGLVMLTLLANQIGETFRSPDLKSFFLLALGILMMVALTRTIQFFVAGRAR